MNIDTNGDGVNDQNVFDTNGDGVNDTWLIDTNGDSVADQTAVDTYGDGSADTWLIDDNEDGVVTGWDYDTDGDGLIDETVGAPESSGIGYDPAPDYPIATPALDADLQQALNPGPIQPLTPLSPGGPIESIVFNPHAPTSLPAPTTGMSALPSS